MNRLLVLSFTIATLISLAAATGVQAFTLLRDVWPTASTTYGMGFVHKSRRGLGQQGE